MRNLKKQHNLSTFFVQSIDIDPIYCIVSMEAYILPHFHGEWNILVLFALLLAFIGFVCTLCWSLFGSAFRLLFSKYAKITNTVMALLLVYCAVSLFL